MTALRTNHRGTHALGSVLCVLAALVCAAPAPAADDTVATSLGAVRGATRNGALEFRGIPYAAPPVGERRWALPRPAAPWTGVRDAANFGHPCPQTRRYALTEASDHEDCLTLSVSRPVDLAPSEQLPVLFWIYGGAFVGGSTNLYRLDKLAVEGRLVVVTANYRMGVFGFMAIPGVDADYNGDLGLEDQRAAMRWVQRNIAAFGGDPNNVTVGGESAGAGSTCMHLQSPARVAGLFHKAIVMSGGCLQTMPTLAAALDASDAANPPMWKRVAAEVGCGEAADVLACLRSAPVAKLLAAQDKLSTGVMALSPVVGNGSVPGSASAAAASGALAKVPLLMGGTRDELRLYVAYYKLFTPFVGDYSEAKVRSFWLPSFYGKDAPDPANAARTKYDAIVAQYRIAEGFDGARMGSMLSDHQRAVGINQCLYLQTADAYLRWMPAIYQMEFADPDALVLGVGIAKGMDPGFALGAVHSSELNYFFPNLSNTAAIDAPDLPPASQTLANQMVAYWAAFVRTGRPEVAGLPAWPSYAKDGANVMKFAPGSVGPFDGYAYHQCGFWNALYP